MAGCGQLFKIISLPFIQENLAIFCSQNFSKPTISAKSFGCGFSPLAVFDFHKDLYISKSI